MLSYGFKHHLSVDNLKLAHPVRTSPVNLRSSLCTDTTELLTFPLKPVPQPSTSQLMTTPSIQWLTPKFWGSFMLPLSLSHSTFYLSINPVGSTFKIFPLTFLSTSTVTALVQSTMISYLDYCFSCFCPPHPSI